PEAGHATRDHNPLDAQAGRHARHARTEVLPGLLDQPGDALVPGVERLQQHRRVDLLQRGGEAVYRRGWVLPRHLPHAPDERPAADERLQTAAVAAATWLPAGVDDDVPDLPCAEVVAEVQLPVEHDPRADAAPDLDHDQVRRVLAAAKAHLGECRDLAVVCDVYGQVVARLKQAAKRKILPVQVDGLAHHAVAGVHQARRADADTEDRAVGQRDEFVDQPVHQLQRLVAVPVANREFEAVAELSAQVHHRAAELAVGKVDGNDVSGIRDNAEEDGRLAARRRANADLCDEPIFHQLTDNVRDSGAGQAGQPRNIGTANTPPVVDGLEDQLAVMSLGVLPGGFLHRPN